MGLLQFLLDWLFGQDPEPMEPEPSVPFILAPFVIVFNFFFAPRM